MASPAARLRPLGALACLLAAPALLGACAAPEPGEGFAELGTGEWRFEPLDDLQPVPLVAGVQGGFHVWASVRTEGLDPERVTLEVETEPVDGSLPPERSSIVVSLEPNEETGGHDFIGWPAVLSRPGCMTERALRVRVRVTDRAGARAADERVVVPMPDAVAPPPEC